MCCFGLSPARATPPYDLQNLPPRPILPQTASRAALQPETPVASPKTTEKKQCLPARRASTVEPVLLGLDQLVAAGVQSFLDVEPRSCRAPTIRAVVEEGAVSPQITVSRHVPRAPRAVRHPHEQVNREGGRGRTNEVISTAENAKSEGIDFGTALEDTEEEPETPSKGKGKGKE